MNLNRDVVIMDLGPDSYEIHIGPGLMTDSDLLHSVVNGDRAFIVTNETVAPLYLDGLLKSLDGIDCDVIQLSDGEQFKTLESFEQVLTELLVQKHNRSTTIFALGGGVVGDTAGFAAASYQRGVDFVQVPTTLLAQVDSSVGGKTAVNHALGKNMIGAFHQPQAVIIDTSTLKTLPARELSAGLAEVIKHGVLADAEFFRWLEDHVDDLLALEDAAIRHAIKRSCEIKAEVVSADEKEQGARATLNLGHTFGHAIETNEGYGKWLHGEAVAAGLVLAADLSMRSGRISQQDAGRIKSLVGRFLLPVSPPEGLTADRFISLMEIDKKATDRGIRLILVESIGEVSIVDGTDQALLLESLQAKSALCE
jgi:3-dehydroquinate synthase